MSFEMNVRGGTAQSEPLTGSGPMLSDRPKQFAIHALACIELHDRLKAEATEGGESARPQRSIPYIAGFDPVLVAERDWCAFYLLCAFGRHAVSVFNRMLADKYGMAEQDISALVQQQVSALEKAVLDAQAGK